MTEPTNTPMERAGVSASAEADAIARIRSALDRLVAAAHAVRLANGTAESSQQAIREAGLDPSDILRNWRANTMLVQAALALLNILIGFFCQPAELFDADANQAALAQFLVQRPVFDAPANGSLGYPVVTGDLSDRQRPLQRGYGTVGDAVSSRLGMNLRLITVTAMGRYF